MNAEAIAPWLALAVALSLLPVYALDARVDRSQRASVVDGGTAYLGEEPHDAVLNASNGYEDEAITITHQHVEAASLEIWVNNTASDPRFTFPDTPFRLDAGAGNGVTVRDTDSAHETGTYLVDARIETQVETDGDGTGRHSMERSLSVTVE